MIEAFIFVFGLIWGSFFNVCIHRLPKEQSVLFPRSHCPNCQALIPWYLNIPVVSFLYLKGRCAQCQKSICWEYPLVEILTGVVFLLLYLRFGLSTQWVGYTVFFSGLWVSSIVDLHHQIIPDEISIGGIPVGFLYVLWSGDILWWQSLLGIVAGGGSFLAVSWVYEKITGRDGLGGGDVKLLAMIGAWLGYQAILPVIVISSAVGSLVGISLMVAKAKGMKEAIPFGPFLAAGAVVQCFWGDKIGEYLFPFSNG
ncbi:MAG: prepilin peptidase [Deltaproteobacteria bacterium]|nr:prepilin peptidase [Deltaproteobacteria bacterium]MBI3295046.1 prepilin peptidase [Deltaproteobacteria bacterium]